MSKRVIVELVDDLDGVPIESNDGGGTVRFALRSQQYEVDLSAANIAMLEEALGPFIKVARQVTGAGAESQAKPRRRKSTAELARVREWARSQGMDVSGYGRVPEGIRQAYREMNPEQV